jgi:hypothetical protein
MNEAELVDYLRTTPPSCLQRFVATVAQLPEPFDNNPSSVWQIACSCGNNTGRFLGYPLRDYNAEYDGPEIFISPLLFECSKCQTPTLLFDTDRHGYHAEVARLDGGVGSAKRRGKGPPKSLPCPSCSGNSFAVTVGFVFWYPDELTEEFEEAWEDLYNVFLCYCQCASCGTVTQPTDFGKL